VGRITKPPQRADDVPAEPVMAAVVEVEDPDRSVVQDEVGPGPNGWRPPMSQARSDRQLPHLRQAVRLTVDGLRNRPEPDRASTAVNWANEVARGGSRE
jgi:hypothetical protein